MQATNPYAERILQVLRDLRVPDSFITGHHLVMHPECEDLVSIGLDMFGREQKLERNAALQWQAMVADAKSDKVELLAISGFRSVDHQRKIIERKLAANQTLEQIIRVSALPGFSEHHTGRAVDIGTTGCEPLVEEFERTPAFAWLARMGANYGFRMSYPRNNPAGIVYEPWHWMFHPPAI